MTHRMLQRLLLVFVLCFAASPALANTDEAITGRLSANWAGYVATRGEFSGVGASWVVPAVAASSTFMTDVTWVGIGGSKHKDLIQAGTHGAVQGGRVQYWAWYELLPAYQQVIPMTVTAGDKVSVTLIEIAPDLWFLSVSNLTTGEVYSKTVEDRSKNSSAEGIEEMPVVYGKDGSQLYAPLSEFGSVTFSDAFAIVDGKHKTIDNARARAATMVSKLNKKIPLAVPSELTETGFSVVRTCAVPRPATLSKSRAKAWEVSWRK